MKISAPKDGGNIRVISAEDPANIRLEICNDFQSHFYQWFYFRVSGAKNTPCTFQLVNAGGAAYTDGFKDYQAVASYDLDHWFRVETAFDQSQLTIQMTPHNDVVYLAYFAPYPMSRHERLVAETQCHPGVQLHHLGETLDGQDFDLLQIGDVNSEKMRCWFIARQHPGETMAEWFIEGLLERLLDGDDPISRTLLERAVFYIVPNMNPDGSKRGHLRTNASGTNLNREWNRPSMARSPEVYLVREFMKATGVDFCLDVHGDEALPCNFVAGAEGVVGWTAERQALQDKYKAAMVRASPDFQTKYGYPITAPGQSDLAKATDYIAHAFGCLSLTLEMPFKDTYGTPNENEGWSPNRSKHLGAATLNALLDVMDDLR